MGPGVFSWSLQYVIWNQAKPSNSFTRKTDLGSRLRWWPTGFSSARVAGERFRSCAGCRVILQSVVFPGLQDVVMTERHPTNSQSSHEGAVMLPLRITGTKCFHLGNVDVLGGIMLGLVHRHVGVWEMVVVCVVECLVALRASTRWQ